jgi:nitrate reductase gamma subunit
MNDLLQYHDQLLFAVLPYVAVVVCLVLLAARRFGVAPFGQPGSLSASGRADATLEERGPVPFSEEQRRERLLLGYGILVILAGHLLGFLIPEQVLLWNGDPVRLYVLEVSALVFGLMILVGLFLAAVRSLTRAEARRAIGPSDWLLGALLLVEVASGVGVALFHPWGSSWYAISVVPYLRSVLRLDPDIRFISAAPVLVKVHVVNAYVLLGFLPLTRLARPFIARAGEGKPDRVGNAVVTAILLVGLGVSLLALIPRLRSAHLPGNHQDYEPVQPIAFSHRLHAGEVQISCLYCHSDAEKSRHAGIPAASICMNCHRTVTTLIRDVRAESELAKLEKRRPHTIVSPDVHKLYAALGLDDNLQPVPGKLPQPIRWVKVHNLPAFAHFDHRPHVKAGVECQRCHGPVETMERVRQVEDLSMGWCVNCHREVNRTGVADKPVRASNDCSACHY